MAGHRWIDLSHPLDADTPAYPGDPPVALARIAEVDRDGYTLYELRTGLHAGTHLDAPLHMLAAGADVASLPLTRFAGRGRLVDARGESRVEAAQAADVQAGEVVLVATGWAARYPEADYHTAYPEVSEGFARQLVERRVRLLGLDTPSPDREPYRVHRLLLGAGIPIVENLTGLEALIGVEGFEVMAFPVRLRAEAAPVRVVARLPA